MTRRTHTAKNAGRIHPGQLTIFPRGGRRRGAGRKPKGPRALVAHHERARITAHTPVLVTLRLVPDLPTLRQPETLALLKNVFARATDRFDFRIVHFSVQSNHLHFLVEAGDEHALGRGMKGLAVRMAMNLNRAWDREGALFVDRFHAEVLQSPLPVRNALVYVLNNARRHGIHAVGHCDPYSSGDFFDGWADERCARLDALARGERLPCSEPKSWLLRAGWRRHGLVYLHEVPGNRGARSFAAGSRVERGPDRLAEVRSRGTRIDSADLPRTAVAGALEL